MVWLTDALADWPKTENMVTRASPTMRAEAVAAVRLAREHCDDVEFSAEDATRTDWDYLEQVSKAVVAAGDPPVSDHR